MSKAKFKSISIGNFKSYAGFTTLDLSLLTVIIGRNNSGKSSIIQALLLLKQTLDYARPDVPLRLEGDVSALSIRELTYGWPEAGAGWVPGPKFVLSWLSTIDTDKTLKELLNPNLPTLAANGIPWISQHAATKVEVVCTLLLEFGELDGKIALGHLELSAKPQIEGAPGTFIQIDRQDIAGLPEPVPSENFGYVCYFNGQKAKRTDISFENFLPILTIDKRNAGPRHTERSWVNIYHIVFSQSLTDLKRLIRGFSYLSSARSVPPPFYRPSTEPLDEVGVSGEYAAEMLQSHQSDCVNYMLPNFDNPFVEPTLSRRSLKDAVNEVLGALGIDIEVSIEEIKNVGFRLLFGRSNLPHVGRGLTYLLPLIQVGLICDPMRFSKVAPQSLEKYSNRSKVVCAFEEPEAHLHPKIQSRLAQWFVSLAMAQRQVIVETHSDHLVRKLRLLVAQAPEGGFFETWLLDNVSVVGVEQHGGVSGLTISKLTQEGGLENWPSEFMDESPRAEEGIYRASLEKSSIGVTAEASFTHHLEHAPNESNN